MTAARKVRYVEERGKRYAMIPAEIYERMLDDLDMLDDIRIYDAAKAKPQEFVPLELTKRLLAGENAIKVWREYRGLTQQRLTEVAGISTPYLSQIENGLREPSVDVLKRLAAALDVDIDDLV
jgi:DNA-binding XRE family transcriptional regulator